MLACVDELSGSMMSGAPHASSSGFGGNATRIQKHGFATASGPYPGTRPGEFAPEKRNRFGRPVRRLSLPAGAMAWQGALWRARVATIPIWPPSEVGGSVTW